jgi:peptidoglycan/xylan/chitin deacetylase (PgdA/CDA1 family)
LDHLDTIEDAVGAPPAILHERGEARRAHAWCLTFDDGHTSALAVAEEVRRRGWRAYFFVPTSLIGHPGFVEEEAIRELDRMGHIVGSHSVTHPERMSSLPADRILEEWEASLARLSNLIGREVCVGAVPGGSYGSRVGALAARAGVTTLFTSEPVTTPRWVDECLVVGRYLVRHGTSARRAGRAAAGHPAPWLVQYLGWNSRKAAKAFGGKYYGRVRRRLLDARYGPPARG